MTSATLAGMRTWVRALACTLSVLMAGCQQVTEESASGTVASGVVDVRRSTVTVPKGYRLQIVEFADASHGYVEFVSGEPVTGGADPR